MESMESTNAQALPPTAAAASVPGPSHQRAATFPIIITVESSSANISFIVTANSITTTAGEWSPILPNLSRGLALPNHISLPTTISIATNTFTINVSVTTAGNTFLYYDLNPTPIPINNNNNNNNVLPITGFPINLTLCLANIDNTNTNTDLAIVISNTFNISISTQSVQPQFGYAAFVIMN